MQFCLSAAINFLCLVLMTFFLRCECARGLFNPGLPLVLFIVIWKNIESIICRCLLITEILRVHPLPDSDLKDQHLGFNPLYSPDAYSANIPL